MSESIKDVLARYPDFSVAQTGGGCTAYSHPTRVGGYLLITDVDDPIIPADDAESVAFGVYDPDGSVAHGYPEGAAQLDIADLQSAIDSALADQR